MQTLPFSHGRRGSVAVFAVPYPGAIVGSTVLNLLRIEIYLRRNDSRRISSGAA